LWSRKAGEANVVRSRQGSVLTRGLVLKTDHFEGTRVRPTKLDLSLQGAPNFRKADAPLEVYGTAQPTITGLRTILAVLGAAPPPAAAANKRPWQRTPSGMTLKSPPVSRQASHQLNKQAASPIESPDMRPITQQAKKKTTVWVCTREEPIIYIGARPFVLREQTSPINTFSLSSRADNLEAIEGRLKDDILREAARFGGLIMVHEEEGKGDEPKLKPTWIAVDTETVKTVRDVFEDLRSQGWACDYHRVPIAPDQPIENNYLDAYTRILQSLDPETSAVVANCGAGVTRTTFAMVAAQIVRRRQWILRGHPDPFNLADGTMTQRRSTGIKGSADSSMAKSLRAVWEKQAQAQALLRLVQLLGTAGSSSPVELMLANPDLLEALRRALTGDFSVIRALCGILDAGIDDKVVVDVAIDSAAHLTNLREAVLLERASYALKAAMHLDKAVRALEKYFFLLAFSSYVNTIDGTAATPQDSFASWLTRRSEIWNTIQRIRSKGKQLYLFDPVADLSQLRRGGGKGAHQAGGMAHLRMATEDSAGNSSEEQRAAAGDEFADHHVRNLRSGIVLRPGTLLKEDLWQAQRDRPSDAAVFDVRGAINFRRIAGTAIFATGQPTVDGIRNALKSIGDQLKGRARISCYWLNLREEPLIYVAGRPMVLRDSTLSLRNIKAYGGISWARLQLLEDRLKADVIHELQQNDGRLLLHSEDANGEIYPQWQEVSADDVETLQDVMGKVSTEVKRDGSAICGVDQLEFRRIPFTAEKPPDYEDLTALLQLVLRCRDSAIVNNCQLGRGRSTLASVIVLLIAQWLREHGNAGEELLLLANDDAKPSSPAAEHRPPPLSYHLINSLLRVIPHGLEVKRAVDEAIDQGSAVTNLRDSIEEFRLAAEEMDGGDDNPQRKAKIHAGCQALRRYFVLILFQSYLSQTKPDVIVGDMPTFQDFVHRQPVLQTISKEFENVSLALITPLQQNAQGSKGGIEAADGMALASEVDDVVAHRDGAILTAYTMLKSDFFSGIAKVHLSQIEGIPNLRQVPLLVGPPDAEPSTPGKLSMQGSSTWGSGMPTLDGLRAGLEKMKAGPKGDTTVVWTSLREEPVVYVRGRPHVLRLADQPLTNLEATGITTETVERQEIALKRDVIEEAARRDGRILLHDEVEVEPGKFDIIPVWESLRNPNTDVLTPAEAYAMVQAEGYRVDYGRVAVTDEQAPLPGVFKAIEGRVLTALRQGAATAFNCQMGRGRTTTGMVIAALVSTVHHHRDEILAAGPGGAVDLTASGVLSGDDSVILDGGGGESTTGSVAGDRMTGAKDFLDNREEELLLNGEYRIILRLVGVLSQGKLAKLLVDEAVDRMDQVQNLRVACYDARLRAENAPVGSAKRRHLSTVFNNYLARYAYLIAFANHLL
ncbi:hypothetical protein BDZ90DRAFT_211139, partial [Jaminaea rosea]